MLLPRDSPVFPQISLCCDREVPGSKAGKGDIQSCFTVHDTEMTLPPVGGHQEEI